MYLLRFELRTLVRPGVLPFNYSIGFYFEQQFIKICVILLPVKHKIFFVTINVYQFKFYHFYCIDYTISHRQMDFTINYIENRKQIHFCGISVISEDRLPLCEVTGWLITDINYELPLRFYNIAFSVEKQTKFSLFFKQNVYTYLFE